MKKYKTDAERVEARKQQKRDEYRRNKKKYQQYHARYRKEHLEAKKEADHRWYLQNKKYKKEYDKLYHQENLERRKELGMKYRVSEEGRRVRNKLNKLRCLRNPGKKRAVQAVNNAIRDGRLVRQPCAICGAVLTQGHHTDYRRKLSVIWLCPQHHKELHERSVV